MNHVLIVDDEAEIRESLESILREEGYLVTASAEFEQMLWRQWGAAVFVDTGNAFDDGAMDLKTAAGLGLRWRSPVGLLKLDVAQPVDDPAADWRLHLSLGSEL